MLFSLALIFLCALILNGVMQKLKLPSLIGLLITGIVFSPYALDLIAPELLAISTDLRQIALIIILFRAGLALDITDLKKVGRPAILMCFIPAAVEIAAITILAPLIFNITYLEAAIMGTILGAVSPAVIIPKMIKLTESGYGVNKGIPQLIMTGASVNGIFVIILFTSLMGMTSGYEFEFISIAMIPIAIIIGLLIGIITGLFLSWMFNKIHIRDTIKTIIILAVMFLLVFFETAVQSFIPMSGLLAVMALGGTMLKRNKILAERISAKFTKIWIPAEIMLFVLVGATINLEYAVNDGFSAIVLIFTVLIIRCFGVYICFIKTKLNIKERIFCCIAYMPKATVQAAIGGIPLAAGVVAGNIILTVTILAILITAPLGAVGIDILHRKMLARGDD